MNTPEADTKSKKGDNEKRKQAKRDKKKAKKRAENTETVLNGKNAANDVSSRSIEAGNWLIAFGESDKRLTDLPATILRSILAEVLPDRIQLRGEGFQTDWKLTWNQTTVWAPKLMLVNKAMKTAVRPLLGERIAITAVYRCPLEFAIRSEFSTSPNIPPPLIPLEVFPGYIVKRTKELRVHQSPLQTMFRSHTMDVSAFRKLESMEVVLGDICRNVENLGQIGDEDGFVTFNNGEKCYIRQKLLEIPNALSSAGIDWEELADNTASELGLDYSQLKRNGQWRRLLAQMLRNSFLPMSRWETLNAICGSVLDLNRENVIGLRDEAVLKIVLQDSDRSDRKIAHLEIDSSGNKWLYFWPDFLELYTK
ncbi:uncharacterized protein AB675_10591 [Cyphellophora attinorum]|uniref:Uncharacterized protein n=1 Tax=Cyphellophora attinorum TaxID=1664694 RepID=A0A0N1HUZ7_9EURO|nr:uncharacterized protein AB675_10591 [Phialophora attinorum]KPI40945.1 hypothetical protein AB675_10591 [Phialophora attinorum]